MDNTNSIQSLTDDILRSVDEINSSEKVASEAKKELKTELGKALLKTANELRKFAEEDPEISYSDIQAFTNRMRGL